MLMKGVLPAPLVPMRPTTESFSIAAFTSEAAVTAPKLLHSPRASRMTGMAPAHFADDGPEPFGQEHDYQQQGGAQEELPRVGREVVGRRADGTVDERAGEGGDHVAGAGEDSDEDEFTRGGPERHVGIDVAHGRRGERPANAGEDRGEHVLYVHRVACR